MIKTADKQLKDSAKLFQTFVCILHTINVYIFSPEAAIGGVL